MIRHLIRRLYRDRRRYAICAVLLFAAGAITFADAQYMAIPGLMPFIAGLAFMAGIGIFAPLLCLALPSWRFGCEVIAFALFIKACLDRLLPQISLGEWNTAQAVWFIVGVSFLTQLYLSNSLDRYLRRSGHRQQTAARSRLDPQTLFDGLAGRPENAAALAFSEEVVRFEHDPNDSSHLILELRVEPFGTVVEHHLIRSEHPPFCRTFDWTVENPGPNAPFTGGRVSYDFLDKGKFRRIERVAEFDSYPLRAALFGWIDDSMGRTLDDWVEELERRKHRGGVPSDAIPAE